MNSLKTCWAKTTKEGRPGISVYDHCVNVGCVAEALMCGLPTQVRNLLPKGAVTLAALHDVGKATLGFQVKCPGWLTLQGSPNASLGEAAMSVSDHAYVSQAFLQELPNGSSFRLWAVAVGAHHGRPKGRKVRLNPPVECQVPWAQEQRFSLLESLRSVFGPLPTEPPQPTLAPHHTDLWLLAGLISVADWIGSNETWFPPDHGLPLDEARKRAHEALRQIGWPGGALKPTSFSSAFASSRCTEFFPNPLQQAVASALLKPGVIVVEGPMGCGKTEAALFAAQQLITSGHHQGIYFALPTQVTSNRIHRRIETFLRNTLADGASLRLAHGNAWLEDDFNLRLAPAFPFWKPGDGDNPDDHIQEGRSWFASAKQALLAPYGVGTIDQALQAVVAVKHFFVRRFALAGKVIVLDEVHSYDIYTGTLISALIRELVNLRCTVIILSATLTAARRSDLLEAAGMKEDGRCSSYPMITSGTTDQNAVWVVAPEWPSRRPITIRPAVISEDEVIEELIRRAEARQHVLWIRNTVVEAQDAFRAVSGALREDTARLGLLHSRFPFHRRVELEHTWLELLGRERPVDGPGSILIATQVVEQSVDIDLDFIVSDLAPTDMLLQRVGRLWRHDRAQREAASPEFWVRMPELRVEFERRELIQALGRSACVYAPYVLLRTYEAWRSKTQLLLPADIRPLLEATYAEMLVNEPKAWQEFQADLEVEKQQLAANAEAATLVLGRPMLDDREEILTRRKGAPTTPVLLLRSVKLDADGVAFVVALDGTTIEISQYEWRRASARFLHQWIVRAPRWMVPDKPPHPRWLTLHTTATTTVALVGDDGTCDFGEGGSVMAYDPRLGTTAKRSTGITSLRKEYDDEFDS